MEPDGQDNDVQPFPWVLLALTLTAVLIWMRRRRRRRIQRVLSGYVFGGDQASDAKGLDIHANLEHIGGNADPPDDVWDALPADPISEIEEHSRHWSARPRPLLHASRARVRLAIGILVACLASIALLMALAALNKLAIIEAATLAVLVTDMFARLDVLLVQYFRMPVDRSRGLRRRRVGRPG